MSRRPYTWVEIFVIVLRLMLQWIIEPAAIICGAVAVRNYGSLPVLAVLPVSEL